MNNLLCYKTITLTNENQSSFFLNKHSTQEGTWGRLILDEGTIELVFLDGNEIELTRYRLDEQGQELFIPPAAWHKVVPVTDTFRAELSFHCPPHRYFNKKHGLGNVHGDLLYMSNHYLDHDQPLNILDVGCGSGRNLFYLALMGHSIKGIDIKPERIDNINTIADKENMDSVEADVADLHEPLALNDHDYDFVLSTVTLQFLDPERIPGLLEELQQATKPGGMNFLVFAVRAQPYNLPSTFTYLAETNELYHFYQDRGWAIIEYKETVGQLHKTDEEGRPIQGLFGMLLAQKV